ncbi:MAG TPA: glycosyltransferase family 9 protein [bacterium]|nr:glycosyltransferase family 9 protein [bacterium]
MIIRLSSLGDVLLALPALGPVAKATGASLAFVTRQEWAPLAARHPAVDVVATMPSRGEKAEGAVNELIRRLNEEIKPDIILDWHGVPLARYVASHVSAYEKFRYPKHAVRRWLLAALGIDLLPKPTPRVPELYARAAAKWGVKGPDWSFRLAEDEAAAEKLRRDGLTPGRVALAPAARHAAKAWPAAHWRELAQALAAEGHGLLLLGDETERPLCEEVAAGIDGAVNLAGRVAVGELPEALRGAALLVGNDSALNHLAPLVDVPCLALFGPTSPRFGFAPWGTRDRTIYLELRCSPCSKHGRRPCWRARRRCMEDIQPAAVAAAAREMLGAV